MCVVDTTKTQVFSHVLLPLGWASRVTASRKKSLSLVVLLCSHFPKGRETNGVCAG